MAAISCLCDSDLLKLLDFTKWEGRYLVENEIKKRKEIKNAG